MGQPSPQLVLSLVRSLGVLALPAQTQADYLSKSGLSPLLDELALTIADFIPFLESFLDLGWLSAAEIELVRNIDAQFAALTNADDRSLFQLPALGSPPWQKVRATAQQFFVGRA